MASRTYTSSEIAELAMRKSQVLGSYDTAATEQQTSVALKFLDLIMAEFISTEELQQFTAIGQTLSLATDTASYVAAFTDELDYVHEVSLRSSSGLDTPLKMLNRQEYDEIEDKTKGGLPRSVYIPNDGTNTYIFYPVPTSTHAGKTVVSNGQKFGTNQSKSDAAHGLPASFQRYLVHQLACDVGDGPLINADSKSYKRWARTADRAKDRILGAANKANTSRPRFVQAYMA